MSFNPDPAAWWWRVPVRLRAEPRKRMETHPHFVMRAIWKQALRLPEAVPWAWYRRGGPLPRVLERGVAHDFMLVLPAAEGETAARFPDCLYERPPTNFAVESVGPVHRCEAGAFLRAGPPASDVLQLYFESPWAFDAQETACPWQPQTWQLLQAAGRAVRDFTGMAVPGRFPSDPGFALEAWHWRLERAQRHSTHGEGVQYLTGWRGPLYAKGEWQPWWELLALASEFLLAPNRPLGMGRYVLGPPSPQLDRRLSRPHLLYETWREMQENDESPAQAMPGTAPWCPPGEEKGVLGELSTRVAAGQWQPQAVDLFELPAKPARPGDSLPPRRRTIALLPPEDKLIHRALQMMLYPALDRFLTAAATAWRAGRGVESAREQVQQALRDGFTWVAESDISSFFDDIPHDRLLAMLDAALPPADILLRHTLRTLLELTPRRQGGHAVPHGGRGLLQGSPLSPLLANFYLHGFDAAVTASGLRFVRYGDDFLMLARSENEARAGLEQAAGLLAELGLSLREDKTRVCRASEGLTFLGKPVGGAGEATAIQEETETGLLRKPLYLTASFLWAGCEDGAVVLRKGDAFHARIPLARVSELILHGVGGLSTALVAEASRQRLPVTLVTHTGEVLGPLHPQPRAHFASLAAHHARHAALDEPGILAIARSVVEAKLDTARAWLVSLPKAEAAAPYRALSAAQQQAARAPNLDVLRGVEGGAARQWFAFLRSRIHDSFFHSTARLPRERRDPWNVLLDIASHLLFVRTHALVRSAGLNPFLGFLHSAEAPFPSLVCDLQEPFRARLERWLVRSLNLGVLKPDHFEQRPADHRWRLLPAAQPALIESFETEMDTRLGRDTLTLRQLTVLQVQCLRAWAHARRETPWFHRPVFDAPPRRRRPPD